MGEIIEGWMNLNKTVKVTYNTQTLETTISIDGKSFDTSRINGREIADWAYPFMMRKVSWNGFYEEMVQALNGEKSFDLMFDGSDTAFTELQEALVDVPVNIITENEKDVVIITYDETTLTTQVIINGKSFDTSRINGREIADWIYPFIVRKIKWDGIFKELELVIGSPKYSIEFSGSNSALNELKENCPETVKLTTAPKSIFSPTISKPDGMYVKITENGFEIISKACGDYYNGNSDNISLLLTKEIATVVAYFKSGYSDDVSLQFKVSTDSSVPLLPYGASHTLYSETYLNDYILQLYPLWDSPRQNVYRSDHGIRFDAFFSLFVEISSVSKYAHFTMDAEDARFLLWTYIESRRFDEMVDCFRIVGDKVDEYQLKEIEQIAYEYESRGNIAEATKWQGVVSQKGEPEQENIKLIRKYIQQDDFNNLYRAIQKSELNDDIIYK